jgi:multiple sugar transport system ATP-binding protein
MGERTGVLYNGQLQQFDAPDVIYTHPKNRFVANFIGSPAMNFLDCTYEEKDGKLFLIHEAFSLDVTEHKDAVRKGATSKELTLGIRPEHIRVADKPPSKEAIKATVYTTELLGSETLVGLQVGSSVIKAIVPMLLKAGMGEEKFIEFDNKNIHIVDRKTEKVIT